MRSRESARDVALDAINDLLGGAGCHRVGKIRDVLLDQFGGGDYGSVNGAQCGSMMENDQAQQRRFAAKATTGLPDFRWPRPGSLIAISAFVLIGCQSNTPSCGDEEVLSAVRQLLLEPLRANGIKSVPEFRREQVLVLASEWVAGAKFAVPGNEKEDPVAKRLSCRSKVTIPLPPSIHQLMEVNGFHSAQKHKDQASLPAKEFRMDIAYTVEPGEAKKAKFSVKDLNEGPSSIENAQSLLLQVLAIDEIVRVSATAANFVGKWKGTMSCSSEVTSDYPDQPPPKAWRSPYSEAVEFDLGSVFNLPMIPLTGITPQQSAIWTVGLGQPVLIAEIPYHVSLARVVDAKVNPQAINFSSPAHGAVAVNLAGEVRGDRLRAQGLAVLGAGMLRSQKPCELLLTRHR